MVKAQLCDPSLRTSFQIIQASHLDKLVLDRDWSPYGCLETTALSAPQEGATPDPGSSDVISVRTE